MKKTKPRGIETMPLEIKRNYFQILLSMGEVNGIIDPLEMAELYRLMAKFKYTSKGRIDLLKVKRKNDYHKALANILQSGELDQQEKNIVRFSLIKDLLIVMEAGCGNELEKIQLFNEIKETLYITDEQLQLIKAEDEENKNYFEKASRERDIKNTIKATAYQAIGIGVPLTAIYADQHLKQPKRRWKKQSLTMGKLGKYALLGMLSSKSIAYLLERKKNKKLSLDKKLFLECSKVHERAKLYVANDIIYLQKILPDSENKMLKHQIKQLKKAVAILEKTEPKMI